MESFAPDPNLVTLERFYALIRAKQQKRRVPGLGEKLNFQLEKLSEKGISNLGQLLHRLGTKKNLMELSVQTGILVDDLCLLKREAGSCFPRARGLSLFPGIPYEFVEVLNSAGIKNSRNFFESTQSEAQRKTLSTRTGIPVSRILEIRALCDISRIARVGGTMARNLLLAGVRSVDELAGKQPSDLYDGIESVMVKYKSRAGHISMDSVTLWIVHAQLIRDCRRKEDPS